VLVNYCRHRGAKPAHGCGNTKRFACPYHGWVYDSRGALVGIPGPKGFTEVERSETGLVELPTEERHGLIWAVLTAGEPLDLDAHLGPLGADLEFWEMAGFHYLKEREFESPANWKSALEAFAESYHFPYVHSESLIGQNTIPDTAVYQQLGRHHRISFPTLGVRDLNEDSNWDPIENLANIYWIYPNLVLAFTQVGVELIDILPGDSPISCRVRHGWMARFPATTSEQTSGYEHLYELVHAAVRDEDFGMLPQCGEAVRHAQHSHMLIGRNEIAVQNVIKAFSGALGFELTGTTPGPSR
jgi:choline monooxygenase